MTKILSNLRNIYISCGGLKGCSAISFLQEIEPLFDYNQIQNLYGCSIGGIIVSLWNLGYTLEELYQIFRYIPFSFFQNIDISLILEKNGLDTGENYYRLLISIFQQKNIPSTITFLQLFQQTNKSIYLVATNLTNRKPMYFSHITTPHMPLILAIRATTCIPYFYTPIEYEGNLYIDGGILEPVPIFENSGNSDENMVILLQRRNNGANIYNKSNLLEYTWGLFETMFHHLMEINLRGYKGYLIEMENAENISDVDGLFRFDMTKEDKDIYFDCGRRTAYLFIDKILANKKIKKYFYYWKKYIHHLKLTRSSLPSPLPPSE